MADKEISVKVQDLTKTFKIPLEASNGIKQKVINSLKGRKGYREFSPLKGVSFEIEKGDFFGIVGRNGSGKSTLLKTLAGIYAPNDGLVQVNGKLVPFIELGVGFNPELTGRENVFLNGALLGFSHKQMEDMYDDIVEFAELGEFMEERLKNYSSGMQVRLAFSIAIRADGDILLLDEVLAVGDEAFQRKCNDYFHDLKRRKKTVILVTHGMDNVRKFCNKAMMIRDGEVVIYGSPEDVANEYSVENLSVTPAVKSVEEDDLKPTLVRNLHAEVLSGSQLTQDKTLEVKVSYESLVDQPTKIRLALRDIDREVPLIATSTKLIEGSKVEKRLKLNLSAVNDSKLKVQVSVRNEDDDVLQFMSDQDSPSIVMHRTDYPNPQKPQKYAVLFDRGEWS